MVDNWTECWTTGQNGGQQMLHTVSQHVHRKPGALAAGNWVVNYLDAMRVGAGRAADDNTQPVTGAVESLVRDLDFPAPTLLWCYSIVIEGVQ